MLILSEKMTSLGQTRFENRTTLPLGAAVNSASFAAKVLAQSASQPRSVAAYSQLGVQAEILVLDSSDFANLGEEISFLQLQARCATVQQTLLGYYILPTAVDEVLSIEVNPGGYEERAIKRVWNSGDGRCKLITLSTKNGHHHMKKKKIAVDAAVVEN